MSKYTTEIRFICETQAGLDESVGYNSVDDVIEKARPKIFSFKYPIFDEDYRAVLETKILKHYYTREIGEETYGLWKLRLDMKLNEIMPYYNKMYETELLEFNPLYNADYYRKGDRKRRDDNTRTDNLRQETNTKDRPYYTEYNMFSDTPQGALDGIEGVQQMENSQYLTTATKIVHDGEGSTGNAITDNTGNTHFDGKTTDDYLEHIYGKFPGVSFSQMVQEYRDILINIDMMIIDELKNLFLNLW